MRRAPSAQGTLSGGFRLKGEDGLLGKTLICQGFRLAACSSRASVYLSQNTKNTLPSSRLLQALGMITT